MRRAGDSLNAYRVETYSRGISLPPGGAALVVTRGPNEGSRYILKEDTLTIGRDAASSIMLDDITVSRRHAEVR
ncbi:MAG: FHA domain-containing protein, partial [Actinomycetota bacterium]|nr:FHA domain-containing protein [Actinomycetota bacterium]